MNFPDILAITWNTYYFHAFTKLSFFQHPTSIQYHPLMCWKKKNQSTSIKKQEKRICINMHQLEKKQLQFQLRLDLNIKSYFFSAILQISPFQEDILARCSCGRGCSGSCGYRQDQTSGRTQRQQLGTSLQASFPEISGECL